MTSTTLYIPYYPSKTSVGSTPHCSFWDWRIFSIQSRAFVSCSSRAVGFLPRRYCPSVHFFLSYCSFHSDLPSLLVSSFLSFPSPTSQVHSFRVTMGHVEIFTVSLTNNFDTSEYLTQHITWRHDDIFRIIIFRIIIIVVETTKSLPNVIRTPWLCICDIWFSTMMVGIGTRFQSKL